MIFKRSTILFFAIVALFGVALVVVQLFKQPITDTTIPEPSIVACPNVFTVSGNKGFTAGLDAPDRAGVNLVRSAVIDSFKYIPMTQLEMFHLEEDVPFLWMTPDRKEAVVDERFFGNLTIVEVVGGIKDEITVGTARPELLRRLPPDIIVRFLLQSEIIRTYWHIKAELCPTIENQTADIYEQRFFATHTYCTNECLAKSYTFTVRINKRTGVITVR